MGLNYFKVRTSIASIRSKKTLKEIDINSVKGDLSQKNIIEGSSNSSGENLGLYTQDFCFIGSGISI